MGSSILICPMCCGETFDNFQSLKYHLLSMTDNLYCPGCSKRFESLASLIHHLDKCTQDENINLVMEQENFSVEESQVLMDSNVDINSSFLTSVNNQVMIVGGRKTIQLDENGRIQFVDKMDLSEKSDNNSLLDVKRNEENLNMEINTNLENLEDVETDIGPTISIPDSGDQSSVIDMLPNESTDFLEADDDFMELKQEESIDDELMNVKEDIEDKKNDQSDTATVYNCSSCGMSFSSILDHIKQFHDGQEVVLEVSDELMKNPELSTLKETPSNPKSQNRPRQTMNTIRTEECVDSEGRVYTRKVVQIERFGKNSPGGTVKNNFDLNFREMNSVTTNDGKESKKRSESANPQRIYRCNQCLEQFQRLNEFRTHVCLNGSNQCEQCDQAFATAKALQIHLKVHNVDENSGGQKSFVCGICGTEFTSHKSLRLHSRMHAPVRERHVDAPEGKATKNFTCLECGKILSESYREAHMSLHLGDTVTCAICNRKFDSAESLAMHAAVHPELGVQQSPQNIHQTYQEQLNEGIKSITQNQSISSIQTVSVSTASSSSSTVNVTVNNFEDPSDPLVKPYQCQHCGRRFSRPHEKVKHERIHTGEKPHECEVCGKKFRVSYCLTLHMRTHTGVRPYQCQHCGKRFKASSVYNHHLLTHGDARAYTCPYCPKTFKTRVQLAGHKNSHTKPFRCTECSRPFASLYAARAHIQTHKKDNNLKFSCLICGASYGRAFALKDHLKTHDSISNLPEPLREEEVNEEINFHLEVEEEVLIEKVEKSA